MKPQTYDELREHLDTLSLFAGRSPLGEWYDYCSVCMVVMFLWCVQEVAGLKVEDLSREYVDPIDINRFGHGFC